MKKGNRGTFYFSAPNSDWTWPGNDALWQDAAKTLCDPCPPGWRVPRSGEGRQSPLTAFSNGNGPWVVQNGDAGHLFDGSVVRGGTAWYTACGWRGYTAGQVNCVLDHADIWFSTAAGTGSYNLYSVSGGVFPSSQAERAYGFPVRCIRE